MRFKLKYRNTIQIRNQRIDLILLLVGRAVIAAQSLLALRISTTILGPSEIGRFNLLFSVTSCFVLLVISPVGSYVYRQTVEWYEEKTLTKNLQRFAIFLVITSFFATVILTLVFSTVGVGTPIKLSWLLCLVIANLLFQTLNLIFITILNILGYRFLYVTFMNLTLWLGLGVAIGLTFWIGKHAEYWMAGLLIGQVTLMIPSGIALEKILRRQFSQIGKTTNTAGFDVRSLFLFSLPLILSTSFYWMQTSGYGFVLIGFTDASTLGLLTTGLAIGSAPLKLFEIVFTEYYQPIFYRDIAFADTEQKIRAWNRYFSAYLPGIALMGTFIAFGGSFLSRLLVSEEFYQVAWLSLWGALIQSALMVYSNYVAFSFALLDTRRLIVSNFFGALIAVGGTFLLASWNPLLGTAIALFLGMLITMLMTALNMGTEFSLQLPWRRLGKTGILSLPLIFAMEILHRFLTEPTILQSLMSLTTTGIYMLFAQFILAREWMFFKPNSVKD